MIKSGFSYLKLAAVVTALAMTLVPSMRTSTAKNAPAPVANTALGPDLANEERVIAKYFDDLIAYEKQAAEVGKRARLVCADLDSIQRQSDDLKGRLSGVQSAVGEIVKKLKAAHEWNDLDPSIAARITDASQRSFFQQSSFKQLLEGSSSDLSSHANEISLPVENLRKRLTSRTVSPYGDDAQLVQAAFPGPAPFTFTSLRCTMAHIRIGLIHRLGRVPTQTTVDKALCACDPQNGVCATI